VLIFFHCALCVVSHIYSYIFCAILLYMFCCVLGSIAYRGIVPLNSSKSLLALWSQHVDGAEVVAVLIFFFGCSCPERFLSLKSRKPGEILSEFFYQKVGNFFIKK
jgi:hypothetical protein